MSSHVEKLVHVEIALEDPLLHGIRHPRLGHLTNGWLHDRNALSTLVRRTGRAQHGRGPGDGASLGSRSEVLSEIVTFAIWVPNASVALPNIPHCTSSEAQPSSKGCGWVAAASRCGRGVVIFEGALVDRARVGAGDALGSGSRGLEEWGRLARRSTQTDSGERKPPSLSVGSSCGDGARGSLSSGLLAYIAA